MFFWSQIMFFTFIKLQTHEILTLSRNGYGEKLMRRIQFYNIMLHAQKSEPPSARGSYMENRDRAYIKYICFILLK